MADFLRRTGSFVKRHTLGRYDQAAEEPQRKKGDRKDKAAPPLPEAPETEAEETHQHEQQQYQRRIEEEEQQQQQQQEEEEQEEEAAVDQDGDDTEVEEDLHHQRTPPLHEGAHSTAEAAHTTNTTVNSSMRPAHASDLTAAHPDSDEQCGASRASVQDSAIDAIDADVAPNNPATATTDPDTTIMPGAADGHAPPPVPSDADRTPSPHTCAGGRGSSRRRVRAASALSERTGTVVHLPAATTRATFMKHKRSISDVVSGSFMTDRHSPDALSDGTASDSGDEDVMPCREGVMAKWTNYIHGWQDRYVVLQKGILSYFKSADDKQKFCRGTVDVVQARVKPHPYDQLRFDVILKDHAYYLRASSTEERGEWVKSLQETQRMRAKGLTRRPSSMSLTSISSGTSGHSYTRSVTDKYMESKALHDAFVGQIDQLQRALASLETADVGDLQRDAALVKSTSSGLLRAMTEWMDVMSRREEEWQRKYERLSEKKRKLELEVRSSRDMAPQPFPNNPDLEEGPHSMLNDEEFFDALEIGLDQLEAEEEEERRERELEAQRVANKPAPGSVMSHQFSSLLEGKLKENLKLADEPVEEMWLLTHEEGQMTVYTRNEEAAGETTDQLKAFHFIPGLTGREVCSYFFDTDLRLEWEHTVEKFFVLEWLDNNTNVCHNIHKRVWPTAQRDSCILSHMRQLNTNRWMVQNTSVDHDDAPANKYVRLTANVLLMAETQVPASADKSKLTRADIGAKLTYLAYVHPGGWAPASVVKAVSKREYPKFLSNLETHSLKHFSSQPILW
ncbi:hypothetical protein PTSG_04492 [Salpingoeca rosetta]|uniref:Collagen type IV alpha-3-binding protein n=1 Tax=Salpingoeca rosetta (strain ATCC 50818 / BSB-021) TaxID=946362 RepID=F2U8Q4_SALR5|nr:uncharacterized protein PTSG_04492 [Salpingoeca rosetta]EGD72762.1 hypothetical protein PTSG_04492 [Salpingoeca rosetta]|eukprot:XP_004994585.1 hypothetical protein PTSG_04492 [Salpingoeca rosetta]